MDVDKPISIEDGFIANVGTQKEPDPLIWYAEEHSGKVHLVITDGAKVETQKGRNGSGDYPALRTPTIIIFYPEMGNIYRYDNVLIKKSALRRAFYSTTMKAIYGRVRYDNLEESFSVDPISEKDPEHGMLSEFVKEHCKYDESNKLSVDFQGVNGLQVEEDPF